MRNDSASAVLRRLIAALLLLSLASGVARAADDDDNDDTELAHAGRVPALCPTYMTVDGYRLPYCRSQPLDSTSAAIRRVIIVIHGKNRNAVTYYSTLAQLGRALGKLSETLIIAPQFLNEWDVITQRLPSDVLYWTDEGWKHGYQSLNGSHISSFEVLDRILKRLTQRLPKLEELVIAGHSAGGQFTERHAIGRRLNLETWTYRLRYVVANPGAYMYLTPARPRNVSACVRTYNNYRYGYEKLDARYFRGSDLGLLWKHFAAHRVALLLGDQDTALKPDASCEALAQGAHRFERGLRFYDLMTQAGLLWNGGKRLPYFTRDVVRNVGHSQAQIWNSSCGRALLFGPGYCGTARGG